MTNIEIGGLFALAAFLCAVVAFAHAISKRPGAPVWRLGDTPPPLPFTKEDSPVATPRKQSSRAVSRLAARILRDKSYRPKIAEVRTLAASVLSQDETAAPRKSKAARKV